MHRIFLASYGTNAQGPDDAGPCAYANAVSIKGFDVFTARRQSTPSNRSDDGGCDNQNTVQTIGSFFHTAIPKEDASLRSIDTRSQQPPASTGYYVFEIILNN